MDDGTLMMVIWFIIAALLIVYVIIRIARVKITMSRILLAISGLTLLCGYYTQNMLVAVVAIAGVLAQYISRWKKGLIKMLYWRRKGEIVLFRLLRSASGAQG